MLLVPAWKKALVNPDNPSPLGEPSLEAVLQADKITISEFKFNFSISVTVKIPSLSFVDFLGGVRIRPGSAMLLIWLAITAWVAKEINL